MYFGADPLLKLMHSKLPARVQPTLKWARHVSTFWQQTPHTSRRDTHGHFTSLRLHSDRKNMFSWGKHRGSDAPLGASAADVVTLQVPYVSILNAKRWLLRLDALPRAVDLLSDKLGSIPGAYIKFATTSGFQSASLRFIWWSGWTSVKHVFPEGTDVDSVYFLSTLYLKYERSFTSKEDLKYQSTCCADKCSLWLMSFQRWHFELLKINLSIWLCLMQKVGNIIYIQFLG